MSRTILMLKACCRTKSCPPDYMCEVLQNPSYKRAELAMMNDVLQKPSYMRAELAMMNGVL